MSAGYAALEVVRELTPDHEPVEAVFASTVAMLDALDADGAQPQQLLVCFMAHMMGLAGFAPQLDACGECGRRPGPEQSGMFDARRGHLVCRACGAAGHKLGGSVRAALAEASRGDFRVPAGGAWSMRDLGSARDAMRAFIEHRIGKELHADLLTPVGRNPKR